MPSQVFISYASEDLKDAREISSALNRLDIEPWLAPLEIGPGEEFPAKIGAELPLCSVFLLLWSKNSAVSRWVRHEIALADKSDLFLIPVHLDGTEPDDPRLSDRNWVTLADLGPLPLAQAIKEHLNASKVPYPLGRLYRDTFRAHLDFSIHLEAVRLLMRFVLLAQITRYSKLGRHSDELDRQIEQVLPLQCLFADRDVAHQIAEWLNQHGNAVNEAFGGFFNIPRDPQKSLNEFKEAVEKGGTADEFDRKNLWELCESPNYLSPSSRITPEQAEANLCRAVRKYLQIALSREWARLCRFTVSFDTPGGGGRRFLEGPLSLSASEASLARLALEGGRTAVELEPFFTLIPGSGDALEVGLLRRQNGLATYSALAPANAATAQRPSIRLPWGRFDVSRTLPETIYSGQRHAVQLHLTNRSPGGIRVPPIVEHLPDNLVSETGSGLVTFASEVRLDAGESRVIEYFVRGGDVPGNSDFQPSVVSYVYQDQESTGHVAGDITARVRTLPAKQLKVRRRLENRDGEPVAVKAALDAEMTVHVEIQSMGAATGPLRLYEDLEGAVLVGGDLLLHEGPVDRVDLEKPIERSYRIRVTGRESMAIRLRQAGEGAPVPVDGAEFRIEIEELPPARITLAWDSVMRRSARELEAVLRLENAGGTSAAELKLSADAPGDVAVSVEGFGPDRLEPGASRIVRIRILSGGIPSDSIRFTLSHRSIRGEVSQAILALNLKRLIEADFNALPVVGRAQARKELSRALLDRDTVAINIHGVLGAGKHKLLRAEIERLRQAEGKPIAYYEADCGLAHSFSEAVFMLLDRMAFSEAPEKRGSERAFEDFLANAGMDETQYKGHVTHLKAFLNREKPDDGTWYALALLLPKLARARGLARVVILLKNVSQFSETELEGLSALRSYSQPPTEVRIVVTSRSAIQSKAVDSHIEVGLLSDGECQQLIGSVFLLPRPSAALESALIERSERVPGNLISLLKQVTADAENLIDFENPAGAHIKDPAAFQKLPTSSLKAERKAIRSSGVPDVALACLVAFREPILAELIQAVARRLEQELHPDVLRKALTQCIGNGWLVESGKGYEVVSGTVRDALRDAAPKPLVEKVNQQLFTLCQEQNRPLQDRFAYLAEAPAAWIEQQASVLVDGLRLLVTNSSFTQVRAVLDRLRGLGLKIDASGKNIELAVIEQELQWAETGDLDKEKVEAILREAEGNPNRYRATIVRLRLMLSAWYSRRANDHLKAAAIAEAAESAWGPFRRRVHLPESHLVFDFYLNLWTVYYRVFDEEKFRRLDAWIWKRLAAKPNGQYDSYVLARFLGLFLELQREFPTAEDRLQYFPRRWTVTKAGKRPIRDNLIEKLTRTERISGSFLDQFLANPDKLNQNNALVLARLYLDLGSALWAQSRTKRLLTDGEGSVGEEKDQLAESYMMRAERIFEQGGFRLDLAQAHAVIGGIYADRLRLAQKAGDAIQATEQCKIAIRWFQVAAADFKAVDARKEAAAAWESYAGIERRWLMYQPDRLFPAIAAYEQLLSMPAAPDQAGNRDAHRLTLVQLYQLAGRLEDAARTLNQMDVCSREVVRRRALIHAAMLLLGSVSITPANEAEFEHDLEVLTVEQSAVSMTRDAAIGQIQEPSDAVGVIAWYLTGYLGQQDGAHALRTLRSTHDEVMRTSVLAGQVRDHLPLLLATMWQMSGAADAEMIQDFSTMVLPLVGAETSGAVNQMLDAVWEWEARRGGPLHLAAPGMSLMLCEARLESGGGAKDNCVIARGVFQRLIALGAWDNRDFTGLVARSLAIMVHSGAPERDDSAARGDLTKLLEDLKSAGLYNAALQILVDIVEMLLSAHKSTQNQWFYDIVKALAPELKPIQERSENNFVEVTRLINVYLQLPSGVADAVALMEKQCEHLLESKDYALLPSYLSFLSDLLGDVLRKESFVDRLLRAIADKADPSLDEADVKALAEAGGKASSRTEAVRAVTRDLCGRIIADLSRQPIKRESMQRVLYNAAKLLRQDEAPGLQAAIYIKLYEIADEADGSSAWAAYVAWSGTEDRPAILSLRDCVALTSYSNDNEDASGKVIGSHRNYLINARTRNLLIHSLAEEDQADPSLAVMYAIFELKRLGFLQAFIARLQEFLRGQNEFLRMQVVTFLYDYLFPGLEGAPLWQKLQKIENERGNLRHQMMPFIETLRQHGATAGQNSLDGIEEKLSFTVQTFLLSNRMRGRAIMHELTERLSLFTLENILDEVQRHLNGKEPTVDFGAILGLWPEDEEKVSSEDSDIEAFLKRDPATLVPPLTLTGFRLIQQGEFVTAERVYRYALRLCEGQGGDEFDATPSVLRGLMESLSEQEKFADARDVAIRLAGILESRSHPDLADVLEQLATILESNHQMPEALPYLRRKLELDRVRRGQDTLGFAVDLNNFSQFLRKVGNLAEAEEGMRQAVAIDKEGRELSDPIIPHRLYNLAVVLLLEGKLDEAEEHIERAWLLKPYPVDLTAARVAFIRLVLALLRGKETALYIGQLKTLLRSDEPLQPSSNILRASFLTDVVDDVARRVSPEAGEMIAAVAAAINDDTYIERLGELPAWRDLPSIPIETPWPPIQRGAKAYS